MKILFVATKPPWPARDGGRVVLANTLRALAARGAQLTLIAPADANEDPDSIVRGIADLGVRAWVVPVRRRALAWDWMVASRYGAPLSIVRHRHDDVAARIAEVVANEAVDVVHAEQLQAFANCAAARIAGLPVVLRAQNVESDLWAQLAVHRPLLRPLLRREARLLAKAETEAVRSAAMTIALTEPDAQGLAKLAGAGGRVRRVPAPFADRIVDDDAQGGALRGDPALVLFGSDDWLPNRDGARWFARSVWPRLRDVHPGAVLHVFGSTGADRHDARIVTHAAPSSSDEPFRGRPILLVPLRVASGVRIKILEAWARGVPVIATPEAARGLDDDASRWLLVARDATEHVDAVARLVMPGARLERAKGATEFLRLHHAPERVSERLLEIYSNAQRQSRR